MLLEEFLETQGVHRLYVGGLATDYCIKATVLEGLLLGRKITLLLDAVAGVDLEPGDSVRALEVIRQGGGILSRVDEL